MGDDSTYSKETCPHCKTTQFIWLGTWKTNTEAAECYSCGKCFLMGHPQYDKPSQEDSLFEIILAHFDLPEEEDDLGAAKIRDALLQGGHIDDPEYGRLDLSAFLKEYAMTEKGEPCRK